MKGCGELRRSFHDLSPAEAAIGNAEALRDHYFVSSDLICLTARNSDNIDSDAGCELREWFSRSDMRSKTGVRTEGTNRAPVLTQEVRHEVSIYRFDRISFSWSFECSRVWGDP
jgi:hypothetical protein